MRESPPSTPAWLQGREESVLSADDAVAFVDAIGFCTIDAPEQWEFPCLAGAFPGRPDSVLGRIWFWKDDLHLERRLYYTRLFGGQPGFISNEWLPVCIAAFGDAADELIYSGRISQTARAIYELLERQGATSSRDLRRMIGPDAGRHSDTALKELDRRFIVTKVGLTGRQRGTYGYVLNLAERWVPEAFATAGRIRREDAVAQVFARLASWGIAADSRLRRRLGLSAETVSRPPRVQ